MSDDKNDTNYEIVDCPMKIYETWREDEKNTENQRIRNSEIYDNETIQKE